MSSTGYRPRFGYDIRINAERPQPRPAKAGKRCAKPGCLEPAEVNVPKSRDNLDDRQWLCREHLRQHNAQWDFFAGMSDAEIERFCLESITGIVLPGRLASVQPVSATVRATGLTPPIRATDSKTGLPFSTRARKLISRRGRAG
jgi:hypothetical protein